GQAGGADGLGGVRPPLPRGDEGAGGQDRGTGAAGGGRRDDHAAVLVGLRGRPALPPHPVARADRGAGGAAEGARRRPHEMSGGPAARPGPEKKRGPPRKIGAFSAGAPYFGVNCLTSRTANRN